MIGGCTIQKTVVYRIECRDLLLIYTKIIAPATIEEPTMIAAITMIGISVVVEDTAGVTMIS